MKKTIISAGAAVVIASVLSGCGEPDGDETAKSQAPSQTFPLSGLQSYDLPDEILEDLEAGGLTCENYERGSGGMHSASSGECDLNLKGGETKQIILMTFSSDTNKEGQANLYRELGELIDGYGFVEGGNWMINCGTASACQQVSEIVGGRQETKPMY